MPKKYYGPKYEKEQQRKRDRQRDILIYLKDHGPKDWEILHVKFDPDNTGHGTEALREVREQGHIEITPDGMAKITKLGLMMLEDRNT